MRATAGCWHMRAAVDTLELSPLHEAVVWDYLDAQRTRW